jgi:serine/threonine-protein kinase
MGLTVGARLGPYEILGALGAGGMGEVYRARDTKLGRDVALKVIPDTFALDADRLARFSREAQVLASLNHPHVAAIYGFEDSGETHALVLELVEGETLADRIARGAIPLDEALPIAKQIAEALEAAHEQGIIHRDLKPANIKITPDGVVKVLDFGLAKLAGPAEAGPYVQQGVGARFSRPDTLSPTITSPAIMTGVGVLLGTAAYMSPEQAKGREADKRSDIWAFGCVLYEMLTGKGPFAGDDVSDTLANVLKREPDWSALPATVPVSIRALLHRCVEKDRRKRVADVSTALFVIDEQASLRGSVAASAASRAQTDAAVSEVRRVLARSTRWRVAIASAATLLVVAAVATTLTWIATRPVPPRVSRLTITPSSAAALSINGVDRDLAITPDGSHVVYVGNRGTQLFVRALDALDPVVVFTGSPRGPFVSPDGQWIGFVDGAIALKKVAVTGGPAVPLATIDGTSRGAAWEPDDTIIFATGNSTTGLQRVAAASGRTTVLTRPDHAQGEADHVWPELLPGGRAVLFTITAATGGLDAAQVAVLDLQTGMRKVLVRGGSNAHYMPSGHLVYAAAGTLRAVPFDLTRLETRGTAVPVIPNVVTTNTGAVDAVVAGDGTLAYVAGAGAAGAFTQRTLVWVDRQGRETPIPAPPRQYVYPRLSPDGTRVAVYGQDQEQDIWVWNLSHTTLTRVTFDPGYDSYPVWTPDGRRLIFTSDRARRAESLLAGRGRHRRGRAPDRESQPEQRDGGVARWPPADIHRDVPDGRRCDAGGAGREPPRDAPRAFPLQQSERYRLARRTLARLRGE